jgi:hypothetical protein
MSNLLLYIDPGSGSYLIQAIIAGVLGFLFYFKNLWHRIRSFFGKKTKKPDPDKDSPNA